MVTLFKTYSSIKNFLYRYTVIKIGKLHIRIHIISDCDRTSLYHNHPFHYASILLVGGYKERYIKKNGEAEDKLWVAPAAILRRATTYHRISEIVGNKAITLFIAWGNYGWNAFNSEESELPDGVFNRQVNGKSVWSKRQNGIWFIGKLTKEEAKLETRHSIHQIL